VKAELYRYSKGEKEEFIERKNPVIIFYRYIYIGERRRRRREKKEPL